MNRLLLTPALLLALAAVALPACPQGRDAAERESPARFSPAAVAQRAEEAAGRSAIPQPGEGFPSALAFATTAPIEIPFAREGQVVPWEKAADYLGGDVITVQGRVADAFQIPEGPCLLKFDAESKEAFYIAAFTRDWPELAAEPAELYRGRVVRVTGAVTPYRGVPQMKVEDPSQVEIVGG